MKLSTLKLISIALVAFAPFASALAGDFFIRNGDRVVFLGDSITEQRLYTTYVEAYALTRHPDWKLTFRNVGWGGDTAWLRQRAHPDERKLFAAEESTRQNMIEDAIGRGLTRDVLPLKPTVVTIKFGMNDHSYQPFREDIFRAYVRSQAELGKVLGSSGAHLAYLTPQPIEEKRSDPDQDPRNQSLRKFSDGLKQVATAQKAAFVDQFDPYLAIMLRERASNPSALIGGGDAVHPGPIGHTLMAWIILKGLGATALVSQAEIDAAAGKVTSAQACRIDHLNLEGGVISFDRSDKALPMPLDPKAEPVLKLAPILDELNRYELKITGLPTGSYELRIDGELAATFSSKQLAQGCNLAVTAGPITRQAQEVLSLVFKKNNLFFDRWRNVQLFNFPKWAQTADNETHRAAELARLDQQIADLETEIDTLRQPKRHHFELKLAGSK